MTWLGHVHSYPPWNHDNIVQKKQTTMLCEGTLLGNNLQDWELVHLTPSKLQRKLDSASGCRFLSLPDYDLQACIPPWNIDHPLRTCHSLVGSNMLWEGSFGWIPNVLSGRSVYLLWEFSGSLSPNRDKFPSKISRKNLSIGLSVWICRYRKSLIVQLNSPAGKLVPHHSPLQHYSQKRDTQDLQGLLVSKTKV